MGITGFKEYLVLGDDVIIAKAMVAQSYRDTLARLGIEISMAKSVYPSKGQNSAEFASKLLTLEGDLSPLPLGTVYSGTHSDVFTFWTALRSRGFDPSPCKFAERLAHGPDLGESFPFAQGRKGWRNLRFLWCILTLYQKVYKPLEKDKVIPDTLHTSVAPTQVG